MEISSLQELDSKINTSGGGIGGTLGKEDFMNLLVTQLKNQNPLDPADPTQFTAQLAQFSQLEQLYNINENLLSLKSLDEGLDRLSALSLIDKYAMSDSDSFVFKGEPVELGFRFEDQMEKATIVLKDEAGREIYRFESDRISTGERYLRWDGSDGDGGPAPEGVYTFKATGIAADGTVVEGATFVGNRITGVDLSNSELLTENGKVKLSEIGKVKNSTSR